MFNRHKPNLKKREDKKMQEKIRKTVYKTDIMAAMRKQKGYCNYPLCKQLNGKRQFIAITGAETDHIIGKKLWRKLSLSGDVHGPDNIELLDTKCHPYKTAIDRKLDSLYNNKENKDIKKKIEGCIRKHDNPPTLRGCLLGIFGIKNDLSNLSQ
jgi:hypothetical protein